MFSHSKKLLRFLNVPRAILDATDAAVNKTVKKSLSFGSCFLVMEDRQQTKNMYIGRELSGKASLRRLHMNRY